MKFLYFCLLCLWFAIAFTSCKKEPKPEPVKQKEITAFWPNKEWTEYLDYLLETDGVRLLYIPGPNDEVEWCMTKYEQPKEFYIKLFSAIAKFESNFNPSTTYKENFKDAKGNFVISTGLLQVSAESCRGYGVEDASNENLKNPQKNLICGVKIAKKWILQDGVIAQGTGNASKGLARYFSTMRTTGKREQIRKMVCGK